jgi:hypothetical protein
MVFIPVRSVTVADPPRTSIAATIMLVDRLKKFSAPEDNRQGDILPEEQEQDVGKGSPSSTNDLEPSVYERCIQLQLSCQLGHTRSSI